MKKHTILKKDLEKMLRGYRLTTADILYRLPDHPHILQQFIWQEFDLLPELPILQKFLNFWSSNIEGQLHSVRVSVPAHGLIRPQELKHFGHEIYLQ